MPDGALTVAAKEAPARRTAPLQSLALAAATGNDRPDRIAPPVAALSPAARTDTQDFAARIRLLIERVGGTGALAQCCGVSESTVRNWRNGHSDISRERCLVLSRALRISLLWLITGEGGMTGDAAESPPTAIDAAERRPGVDSARLAAALQVLQSYIALAGGSLNLAQRAEAVAELYGMLAQPGPSDADRLIAFHATLAAYLRSNRQAVIA
jgi:transcriptional regulator with XRE-family HTH domain